MLPLKYSLFIFMLQKCSFPKKSKMKCLRRSVHKNYSISEKVTLLKCSYFMSTWFVLSSREVVLTSNASQHNKIFITIPDFEKYFYKMIILQFSLE